MCLNKLSRILECLYLVPKLFINIYNIIERYGIIETEISKIPNTRNTDIGKKKKILSFNVDGTVILCRTYNKIPVVSSASLIGVMPSTLVISLATAMSKWKPKWSYIGWNITFSTLMWFLFHIRRGLSLFWTKSCLNKYTRTS